MKNSKNGIFEKYNSTIDIHDIERFKNLDKKLIQSDGKIIHQIWFGIIPSVKKAEEAFEKLKKYQKTWIINNNDIFYHCWNLKDCLIFVKKYFQSHIKFIDKFIYTIQFCDYVRYLILFQYGGLYADMDYVCKKKFDKFEEKRNIVYLVETPNKIFSNDIHVSNSLIFSRFPKHLFWKKLWKKIQIEKPLNINRHYFIMYTTGPGIVNNVYHEFKKENKGLIKYLPYKKYHPFGISDLKINSQLINQDVYAVHIGKGSWENKDTKILLFLYENVYKKWFLFVIIFFLIILLFLKFN